jgi:hypothetical protein
MRATHGTAARLSGYVAQADAVERPVAAGEQAVLRHALVVETVMKPSTTLAWPTILQ